MTHSAANQEEIAGEIRGDQAGRIFLQGERGIIKQRIAELVPVIL